MHLLANTSSYDYEIEQNYKIVFNKFKVLGSNPSEDFFLADRINFPFYFFFCKFSENLSISRKILPKNKNKKPNWKRFVKNHCQLYE
jgi:hypothetical protein